MEKKIDSLRVKDQKAVVKSHGWIEYRVEKETVVLPVLA